jgi:hypothetical protein
MKLLHQSFVKNGAGEVKLVPEECEPPLLPGRAASPAARNTRLWPCDAPAQAAGGGVRGMPDPKRSHCPHPHPMHCTPPLAQLRTCGTRTT